MPAAAESPPDEYERQLAERRKRASRWVTLWYGLTLIPYVAIPAVAVYTDAARGPVLAAAVTFIAFAAATGAVTLRNWSVLTWRQRAFGLAPWAFCILIGGPFMFALLFR